MEFKKYVLENGVRLLTVNMPSFESVTVMVMVGAGSRYETKSNSGISHFLEHMAFKGTKKRPSAMAISSLIDGMGGEFNAFTGKETTGYYIKSAKEKLETSIDVLSDMLLNSLLDPKEIEKEKGVIIEEINLYEDMPMRKIGDIYEQLLYGDTPMGWDIAGDKETIMKITRDDFKSYLQSLYSSDNIAVVVAGGLPSEDKVKSLVESYFLPMRSFKTLKYQPVVEKQNTPRVLVREKKTEQIHIALGVRTVAIDSPKRYSLSVLAAILGGGMSSRLFHEVREKRGLAYYVRTHSDQYMDCGSLVSVAGIDPKRVTEALSVMMEEYQKVASGKMDLTKKELLKAKEFLKGHLVLELEDSRSVASYYAHQELTEAKVKNPREIITEVDKVTAEDVEKMGQEYFVAKGLNLALIGNFEDRKKLENMLKF